MQYSSQKAPFKLSIILALLVLSSFSLKNSHSPQKDAFLFKLGKHGFTIEEFQYYFSKNNDQLTKDSVSFKVNEYLDLFIKFRLKVLEAEQRKMHEEEGFIQELRGYQKQLAKPYLMESKMSESLVLEVYERMKEEVKASHILINTKEDALPEDTLIAYNKLAKIKAQVAAGASFDSLAVIHSQDPSAKSNKGDLGYFSALAMVYPFEDAAYTTPVGGLSDIIRTKFGYHLINVKDRRKARGKIKVAHIMLRAKPNISPEEGEIIASKINSIHKKLTEGENWNELCKLYSEDQNTSNKGGELNWFGTGNLVKEFESASFGLENIEDYSDPFQTRYGWHLVKLLGKKPVEPLEEIRSQLESRISRDGRSKAKKAQTLQTLKKQNNFQLFQEAKTQVLSQFDSTLLEGLWKPEKAGMLDQKLFSLGNTNFSTTGFVDFATKKQRKRKSITLSAYTNALYNQFEEKSIFDFEEKNLGQNNNEYKMILREYRDGILLFNLMEKEVWGKAVDDSVGLNKFYHENLDNYKIGERADVRMFISDSKETIEKSRAFLNKSKKEIDKAFNSQEPLNLQTFDKKVEKGENLEVDKYWNTGIYDYQIDNRWYLLKVNEIIPAGVKPLNTIKGQAISDFQNFLEESWIESLKIKYPVKVNKATLKQVIKKIEAKF